MERQSESGALLEDPHPVEHRLGIEHLPLGWLQHRVHAPDDAHRQDDIRVLAAPEQVAKHVVGNAPDELDDLVVGGLVHWSVVSVIIVSAGAGAWRRAGPASATAVCDRVLLQGARAGGVGRSIASPTV